MFSKGQLSVTAEGPPFTAMTLRARALFLQQRQVSKPPHSATSIQGRLTTGVGYTLAQPVIISPRRDH